VKRREFITGLGGAAAWPVMARAQQQRKFARIAYLAPIIAGGVPDRIFEDAMARLGWKEGQNLKIEYRYLDARQENVAPLVAEVVAMEVDAIVVWSPQLAIAAKQATARTPIIFLVVFDPVEFGLVSNLPKPGSNITGISGLSSVEIFAKRLQILNEVVPSLTRVAILFSSEQNRGGGNKAALTAAAHTMNVALYDTEVQSLPDVKTALENAKGAGVQALYVWPSGFAFSFASQISAFALQAHLPSIYPFKEAAVSGGLIAYAADLNELTRRAVAYVDKILRGTFPGDLPVEQLSKYELLINLQTANALGLAIPPTLLARADEVIE
jgi:putative tryptophan/tyrosine transport system substrate-binding protein